MRSLLPAACVFWPLLTATLSWWLPARLRSTVAVAGHVVALALAAVLAFSVARGGVIELALGDWDAPLGIVVRADGLAAVFLSITAVVTLAVAVHARAAATQPPSLWPLIALLQSGLAAVCVAGDLFNAYVALEVVGLSAVGLVALGGAGARRAALHYLVIAVLGSLFYLVAVGVIYGATGTLDMGLAGIAWAEGTTSTAWPLGLAAVGLALKAALFPLHGWLPAAHAGAPLAASPLLSALVVKAPLFILARLWLEVTGPDPAVAVLLAVLGSGAVLWGGFQALIQTRLKRVVAYSTVAQVGYLFLVFALITPDQDEAVQRLALGAWVTLMVSHALAKSAMFLITSTIKTFHGTDEITVTAGMARGWAPMTLAMGLATISLIGLPVSIGFIGKWQLLSAAGIPGQWWLVGVVLVGSVLSAAYLLRPLAGSLREGSEEQTWTPLAWRQVVAPLGLAVAAFALGLSAVPLIELALVGWEPM